MHSSWFFYSWTFPFSHVYFCIHWSFDGLCLFRFVFFTSTEKSVTLCFRRFRYCMSMFEECVFWGIWVLHVAWYISLISISQMEGIDLFHLPKFPPIVRLYLMVIYGRFHFQLALAFPSAFYHSTGTTFTMYLLLIYAKIYIGNCG